MAGIVSMTVDQRGESYEIPFLNFLFHFTAFRAHYFVPKRKIQSIICIEFFVMEMMVCGAYP